MPAGSACADHRDLARVRHLVEDGGKPPDADLAAHPGNRIRGLQTAAPGLHHRDQAVGPEDRGAAEELQARLHVHQQHLLPLEHQVPHHRLQERPLRAGAALAAAADAAQHQQPHAAHADGVRIRQVGHVRVEAEVLAHLVGVGAGPLLDEVLQVDQGRREFRGRHAEGRGEVRIRVGVDQEDRPALAGKQLSPKGGDGRLADTAFSADGDLHEVRGVSKGSG